ncbi:MAG: hypothetical protein Q8O83_03410 [bacterium]|nr:hypothetical protein [bacterium]
MNYFLLILASGVIWFFITKGKLSNPESARRKAMHNSGALWYFLSGALLFMTVSIPIGLFLSWLRSLGGKEVFWLTEASSVYLALLFMTIIETFAMIYFKNKEKQKRDIS